MQLEISTGGVDVVVSRGRNSRTITTVGRRQTRAPTPGEGSDLVAMVGPGVEVTKAPRSTPPNNPGSLRDQPQRSSHAGHHGMEVATLPTNRAYARGICEGIAVRAGELSLCVGRICVVSAGGAYALALLAIGALGESVSLSEKTKPGR
jgi:hypothetical protein